MSSKLHKIFFLKKKSKIDPIFTINVQDIQAGAIETVTVDSDMKITGTIEIYCQDNYYIQNITTASSNTRKASCSFTNLTAGTKSLFFIYSGDKNFNEYAEVINFDVNKRQSTISPKGKDITQGKNEPITVSYPSGATGFCEITNVGNTIYADEVKNSKTTTVIPNLPAGKYTAIVTYMGNDRYLPTSQSAKFTISQGSAPIS